MLDRRLHSTIEAQVKAEVEALSWKPFMSLGEAEAMTHQSVYQGQDFFHGTLPESADKIVEEGFNLDKVKVSSYGKGFYFTSDQAVARNYGGDVLTSRLDVRHPKTFHFATDLYDWLESENLPFDETMFEGITASLKTQGYDGIEVQDLKYYIVFGPRQVATYRRN
jgi:Poly(ADP-ribose) polymerase catalytic domain